MYFFAMVTDKWWQLTDEYLFTPNICARENELYYGFEKSSMWTLIHAAYLFRTVKMKPSERFVTEVRIALKKNLIEKYHYLIDM